MTGDDTLEIDDAGIRKIVAESNRIQSELCSILHPFWNVPCWKKIGHEGQHWFAVQWAGAEEAAQHFRDALRKVVEC